MKISAICETAFHYQDKIRAIDYVVNVSSNMQVVYTFAMISVSVIVTIVHA